MSTLKTVEPFGDGFISALCPELILFAGLILLIVVPNLGDGKFRIPGTQTRIPWLLGGKRFKLTSDPRLPSWIAVITIGTSFVMTILSFQDGVERTAIVSEGGTQILMINAFSRVFELIFFGALTLASFASMNRLDVKGIGAKLSTDELYNNIRQVDINI